jgi:DNA-binding MarR family transcriptional regulator
LFLYLPEGTLLPEWSQGIAHPEEGSIKSPRVASVLSTTTKRCAPNTPQTSDLRLLQRLFDVCTRTWSPRPRIRLDAQQTHDYLATSAMPKTAPSVPWAIHLTDRNRRYRLLAFDFDSSRHGADIAARDADRLGSVLDGLGVAHLHAVSGPTRGQHIWVRLTEPGTSADNVRRLAHVLRQHYPSLDPSPLTNPATGAVRPPGAPHRHGGCSLPHLSGQALIDTLKRMDVGASPEVVQWLLAQHPHMEPPSRDSNRQVVRIVKDQAGPHLDRPRRPLTARTRALLSTTPPPGTDRSALAHSILLGMAKAGHTLADVEGTVGSAPGLVRLREDRDRGRDDTARQWQRALDAAARFTPFSAEEREAIDDELDEIEAAVTADPTRWARAGGASDERILHALIVLARTARTRTLDIDVRRLAEAAAVDASTVSRRLRVLTQEGWVYRLRAGSGTRASTWELNIQGSNATQGEPAPRSATGLSSTLLDHHTHDVWSNGAGLGAVAARVHWAVLQFGETYVSASSGSEMFSWVARFTGYTRSTVVRILRKLYEKGLLPTLSTSANKDRMNKAAASIGVAGLAAQKAQRHLVDRELHRWWLEELEWRSRCGRKRGVPRTPPSNLTLPIDATARMRYGRFPTRANGRADYRSARMVVTEALTATSVGVEAA